jgi:hypothetical protein
MGTARGAREFTRTPQDKNKRITFKNVGKDHYYQYRIF